MPVVATYLTPEELQRVQTKVYYYRDGKLSLLKNYAFFNSEETKMEKKIVCAHPHLEVVRLASGSYYCPISTHPPTNWKKEETEQLKIQMGTKIFERKTQRPTYIFYWIEHRFLESWLQVRTWYHGIAEVVCNAPTKEPSEFEDVPVIEESGSSSGLHEKALTSLGEECSQQTNIDCVEVLGSGLACSDIDTIASLYKSTQDVISSNLKKQKLMPFSSNIHCFCYDEYNIEYPQNVTVKQLQIPISAKKQSKQKNKKADPSHESSGMLTQTDIQVVEPISLGAGATSFCLSQQTSCNDKIQYIIHPTVTNEGNTTVSVVSIPSLRISLEQFKISERVLSKHIQTVTSQSEFEATFGSHIVEHLEFGRLLSITSTPLQNEQLNPEEYQQHVASTVYQALCQTAEVAEFVALIKKQLKTKATVVDLLLFDANANEWKNLQEGKEKNISVKSLLMEPSCKEEVDLWSHLTTISCKDMPSVQPRGRALSSSV